MHDQTITLFNYSDSENAWRVTVIDGCYFYVTSALLPSTNGLGNSDNSCLIIYTEKDASINGLKYLKPKEYQRSDKAGCFTMKPETDFFLCGAWEGFEDEIPQLISDDEFENGFYDFMNDNYDDVLMIQSAVHYSSLIPHFEVVGK